MEDMAPPPSAAPLGDDIESRLHQSMARLIVKGQGLKRRFRLMKVHSRIGRAETADVLLPHESVSETHAEILFDGTTWTLRDCGSTNGTVADGQHLRNSALAIRRNALLGLGSLQIVFLCVDPRTAARDRRDEGRALSLLTRAGRISGDEARQIRSLTGSDPNVSVAEVLLMETALGPLDWANAIASARARRSIFERLRGFMSVFSRRGANPPPTPR